MADPIEAIRFVLGDAYHRARNAQDFKNVADARAALVAVEAVVAALREMGFLVEALTGSESKVAKTALKPFAKEGS